MEGKPGRGRRQRGAKSSDFLFDLGKAAARRQAEQGKQAARDVEKGRSWPSLRQAEQEKQAAAAHDVEKGRMWLSRRQAEERRRRGETHDLQTPAFPAATPSRASPPLPPMAAVAARELGGNPPGSTRPRISDDVGGVYDRDDSLQENTNPKSVTVKNHPGHNGGPQRLSGNLKPTAAPIIGISGNLGQGQCARRHRPPAMFPKRANTGGGGRNLKQAVPELGSPKVSCIGKVLSGRERARHRSPTEMRGGCCPGFGFSIRRSRSRNSAVESVDWSPPPRFPLANVERERESVDMDVKALPTPAPALGGMRRFASGRRGADWAAGIQKGGRVARSGPL